MQKVRAPRVEAFGAVMHLMAEAPQRIETVRAAVVPAVEQLVDDRATCRAERCGVEHAQAGERGGPPLADEQRQHEVDRRYREGAASPSATADAARGRIHEVVDEKHRQDGQGGSFDPGHVIDSSKGPVLSSDREQRFRGRDWRHAREPVRQALVHPCRVTRP